MQPLTFNKEAFEERLNEGNRSITEVEKESAFFDYKAELEQENIRRLQDDNRARKKFSKSIFSITAIWMFLILVIVVLSGVGILKLSDTVLVALITTTTANVFGFLYVVVNYLFNKDKST